MIEAIRQEYKNNPITPPETPSLLALASQVEISSPSLLDMASHCKSEGVRILLDRNVPTLQQIPLEHIESIISWLELVYKVIKDRSPRDYPPHTGRPNTIPVGVRQDPFRFQIIILDSFDNWYAGYVFRRNSSLNDLSPLNLEKIYSLIIDINEQLQMRLDEKVTIKIDSLNIDKFPLMSSHIIGNSRIMTSFRQDALDFLEHELIISYSKIVPELDTIAIIVNIEEFIAFKIEIAKIYKTRTHEKPPSEKEEQTNKTNQLNDEISYTVTYNEMTGEILINDGVVKKTNLGSLVDSVFAYLHKNSNRKITISELKKATKKNIKDLPKVIENAGFTGTRLKAFFGRVSKDVVYFKPQVTKSDLEKLGITSLD